MAVAWLRASGSFDFAQDDDSVVRVKKKGDLRLDGVGVEKRVSPLRNRR